MNNQTKKRSGIIAFVASGMMTILAVVSYSTNLLGISMAGNNKGITVSGGHSPEYTSTLSFPHLLGPLFIAAAVILLGVGLVLIFRLSSR